MIRTSVTCDLCDAEHGGGDEPRFRAYANEARVANRGTKPVAFVHVCADCEQRPIADLAAVLAGKGTRRQ